MGLLNLTNDGLPSVLIVLWRALRVSKKTKKSDLLGLVAPESLCTPQMAQHTLARWTALGVFEEDGESVGLSSRFIRLDVTPPDAPFYGEFRGEVLRALLGSDRDTGEDLIQALCWFLAQDPFENPLRSPIDAEKLATKQNLADTLQNSTRWPGLRQWGRFLGLIESFGQEVPDPSVAISYRLDEVFGKKSALTATEFVEELSQALPILDQGAIRIAHEAGWGDKMRLPTDTQLSAGLSLSLMRLEAEGRIALTQEADGISRALTGRGGAPLREITLITKVTEK